MANFIGTWVAQEKPAFAGFNEFVATRMCESITRTIPNGKCPVPKLAFVTNYNRVHGREHSDEIVSYPCDGRFDRLAAKGDR